MYIKNIKKYWLMKVIGSQKKSKKVTQWRQESIKIHFLAIQIRNRAMIDIHLSIPTILVLKIPFKSLLLHQFWILINSYDATAEGLQPHQPHRGICLWSSLQRSKCRKILWKISLIGLEIKTVTTLNWNSYKWQK